MSSPICFKGMERSINNYKDEYSDDERLCSFYDIGSDSEVSLTSTDSDHFSNKAPSLITYERGGKEWVIFEYAFDKNNQRSLTKVEIFFASGKGKTEEGSKANDLSFTNITDLNNMGKSCLKTQLIFGASVKIFGKSFAKTLFYSAAFGGTGLVVGAAIGGAVGGIASGGPGVLPGAVVGGVIGGGIGTLGGAGYGIYKSVGDGKDIVEEFYRDYKILKDVEAGSDKSVKPTIALAKEFFISYLEDVNKKEMEANIFCPISKDIMMFPIKTNCEHVFELLSITQSLKKSKKCPTCRKSVKNLVFDFDSIKVIRDSVRGALKYLQEAAGNQKLLLLQKQFGIRTFEHLDKATTETIKNKGTYSVAESRVLYFIFLEYSKNCVLINKHIRKTLSDLVLDNYNNKKIGVEKWVELNGKLQDYFK